MTTPRTNSPGSSESEFQQLVITTIIKISIFGSALFLATSFFNYVRKGYPMALVNALISSALLVIGFIVLRLVKNGKYQLARRIFIVAYFLRAAHLMLIIPDNNFPIAVMYMTIFIVVCVFLAPPQSGHYWVLFGFISTISALLIRPHTGTVQASIPDPIALGIGNYFLPIVCSVIITLLCVYIFRQFNVALHESTDARKQLEKTNKTLENFAYVASHDLQEPLRTVTCYAQLLDQDNQGKLDKDSEEYIHYIVDGAQQMQRLIRDLLQYSRLKTQEAVFQPTDLNEILDRVQKNIKTSLDSVQAQLEISSLPTVKAQSSQMIQLFQNLISNAVKFHSSEPPRVVLKAVQQDDHWLFSVQDNGIGIAPDDQKKIFEIFKRLHSQAKYAGSGMGLSICEEILTIHHGKIWVESELGKGSTFFFTLPVAN